MESGVKRTQRDYTLAFKLGVVDQVEKGELTYKQAQVRYGIQGRSTVLVWMRKHGRLGWGSAASLAAMPIDKARDVPCECHVMSHRNRAQIAAKEAPDTRAP